MAVGSLGNAVTNIFHCYCHYAQSQGAKASTAKTTVVTPLLGLVPWTMKHQYIFCYCHNAHIQGAQAKANTAPEAVLALVPWEVQQQIDLVFIAKMPRVKEPRQVQPQPHWQWLYLPWLLRQHIHKCIFCYCHNANIQGAKAKAG